MQEYETKPLRVKTRETGSGYFIDIEDANETAVNKSKSDDNAYKKGFELFLDEFAECSMCPEHKNLLIHHGACDKDGECAKVIMNYWMEKAMRKQFKVTANYEAHKTFTVEARNYAEANAKAKRAIIGDNSRIEWIQIEKVDEMESGE